jgi:hypothetical protein
LQRQCDRWDEYQHNNVDSPACDGEWWVLVEGESLAIATVCIDRDLFWVEEGYSGASISGTKARWWGPVEPPPSPHEFIPIQDDSIPP